MSRLKDGAATLSIVDDGIVLRDFEPRDQERVRRLILDGLGEHWGNIDESLNTDVDDIAATYAGGRTLVAELHDELIGTGTIVRRDEDVSEIVRMSVAPSARRSGVGRRLVEELVGTAGTWSSRRVVLETSSSWTEVIAFYIACGFAVTAERDGEFGSDTWFEMQVRPDPWFADRRLTVVAPFRDGARVSRVVVHRRAGGVTSRRGRGAPH
ncbi:MAG: GNAT family N-acetyltransferase [Actinobacteria bacterium]|nr:GNAT family N-acetyltransferase [Actinomycetota bacterium]